MAQEPSADELLNTESMIKRILGDMESLREKIKKEKDLFDSTFENDAVFSEKQKKEEEAKKEKQALRQTILKTTAALQVDARLKELREELKAASKSLEQLLKKYQEISHSSQITRDDGEIYEIVTSFKLRKKKE